MINFGNLNSLFCWIQIRCKHWWMFFTLWKTRYSEKKNSMATSTQFRSKLVACVCFKEAKRVSCSLCDSICSYRHMMYMIVVCVAKYKQYQSQHVLVLKSLIMALSISSEFWLQYQSLFVFFSAYFFIDIFNDNHSEYYLNDFVLQMIFIYRILFFSLLCIG